MPSPLAHSTAGYVIYRTQRDLLTGQNGRRLTLALLITLGLSLVPDADSFVGFAFGNFGRYHNTVSHSLVVGAGFALVVGLLAAVAGLIGGWRHARFAPWFLLALLCYETHVIMDFFTVSRGVMLFWPFSGQRFLSPVSLFYGLHWSDGWISVKHLWTFLSELGFSVVTVVLVRLFSREKGCSSDRQARTTPG